MNSIARLLTCIIAILCLSVNTLSQVKPIAFKGAMIYPIGADVISDGVLIIHQGKIVAVGKADMRIPADAQVVDVGGKVIMPGLVDTHSHLGGPAGGDNSAALNPDVRVLDAVNPTSDGFKKALAGGITSINIMPGSGHLLSGQTIYVKMRAARVIEDMLLENDKGLAGGMKMANGTNPMRGTPGFPATRAKSAAMVREMFVKAQEYRLKVQRAGKDSSKLPERDLKMEGLVEVLNGKRIVHFHTHQVNDILTAIRLSEEFGFRVVLHHVSEGWLAAPEIAKAKVPCSIITIDAPGGKSEAIQVSLTTGAVLEKAGVPVSFHTDDGITDSRLFLRSAALMVREGMTEKFALEALTIAGARMLDLDKRIGSLEKGKDADFIILSGHPFSVTTKVEQTWVEGVKRFDIAVPSDKAFLTGGYGVYSVDRAEYHHHEMTNNEEQ